jgi:hypothetical protein
MASLYRSKVTKLAQALEQPESRTEAAEALPVLVLAIILNPQEETLGIELRGDLAAMLGAAQDAKRSPETGDQSLRVKMVAGAVTCHWRHVSWRSRHDLAAEPRGCAA